MPTEYLDKRRPPGSHLERHQDAGGDRWHLDGRPIHAGVGLELLVESDARACLTCDGEGTYYPATGDGYDCPDCAGSGTRARAGWLRCRFEYQNTNGAEPVAWLYLPTFGSWDSRIAVAPGLRCRWPGRAR